MGQVGAERAAEDIIKFVRTQLEDLASLDVPMTLKALAQAHLELVLNEAEGIRDAAKSGYY